MKAEINEQEALARLSAWCSLAEHCRSEVEEKALRWGLSAQAASRIVSRLEEERFVDEERFCRAFIRDKSLFAKWGKMKIGQALRLKRIPQSVYGPLLDEVVDDGEYLSTLRALLASKRKTIRARNDYEARAKLVRFALGRGFSMDDIGRCIDLSGEND